MRNKKLYKAIRQVFHQTPKIVNEEMPCRLSNVYAEYSFTPSTQDLPPACTRGGEQYAISCPFCGDTRQRLYISHMWDTEFVQNNVRYHCSDRLMHCFNEGCVDGNGDEQTLRREKITAQLREALGGVSELDEDDLEESEFSSGNEFAHQCSLPEDLHTLDDPNTPKEVLTYIQERRFDPKTLQEHWGVGWVVRYGKFSHPMLVIPVEQNHEFWFWQGRLVPLNGHVDGEVERDPVTGKKFPKYYFPSCVKKAWALYNLDRARNYDTVFIVEGVTDVWAIGDAAVARFGKQLSSAQTQLLTNQCYGKHIIIVPDLDDPQALDVAKEDLMRLEIQGSFASVKLSFPPENSDPGDMLKTHRKEDIACVLKSQALSLSQVNTMNGICGSLGML